MSMKQYMVDAFTDKVFSGNPAAVCVLDSWPDDQLMKNIALENNLSETAFVVKEPEGYHLRWFTPKDEINLCGHATLATGFVILNYYDKGVDIVEFNTMSGRLTVAKKGELYEMDFPTYELKDIPVTEEMARAFGSKPVKALLGMDLICVFDDEETVRNMQPDLLKIERLPGRLHNATARGANFDCVTRSFAPKCGIPEVKAENFTAIAIYSGYKRTGSFSCSNPKINQFVSNVQWAQNSNFVDIPTDCPQRERAGWTGDIDVFAETACYLADTERFLRKWFGDYISLQKEDGSLPFIVPEMPMMKMGPMDMMTMPWSSAGWSDALINVAMILYRFYGDKSVLEQVYDAAKKYIDYDLRRAAKKHFLHKFKMGSHYKYILDTGYHWGEWLEPGGSNVKDGIRAMFLPDAEVATAWLYHSTRQVYEMAIILGKHADSEKYGDLAEKVKDAYRREFLKGGTVKSKRQCRYVRPVSMGVVTENEAKSIVANLNKMVIANDYKIGTGFLTTYQVLQTLTDYGYAETAYKMMEQEQCPGWLFEVVRGATTTWETWDTVGKDGSLKPVSLNHYAPGAACAWLFSHVGGIQPRKPGFSEVWIKPIPGGTLTYADTTYESRHGAIVSNWKRDGSTFFLHVEVPEGVTATVVLPDGSTRISTERK